MRLGKAYRAREWEQGAKRPLLNGEPQRVGGTCRVSVRMGNEA
ncbi:hypothetical protein [Campylobacter sp.]|nr:hypothetical protein [Campylobacter sp.]